MRRRMTGYTRASSVHVGLVLAALAASAACRSAAAAQWSIEPQLGLLLDYNSNLLLVPSGEQASGGMTVSVDATMKRVTESTEMDLHPHLELQRFPSEQALNADNGSVQGSYAARAERSSVSVTGSYEKASTLTTELSETGIVDTSTRRETTTAGLTLGHDLSERQHLDLQVSYTDVVYPGGEQVGLVGYRYPSGTLTYTFGISERTSLAAGVVVDQLQAPLTGYEAHDQGIRLTLKHAFSTRLNVSAVAGGTNTTVAGVTQHGYVWDLHATYNSLLTQWDVDYSQSLQPSGRGYLVRRDAGNLTISQNVAARLYATLTVQDIRNSQVAGGPFQDVPHYFSGDAGFDWHASEHVVVSVTAGLAELEEPVTYQTARGWHAAVNTRWTPMPLSISR
jgi:hypothetical protein